MNHLGTENHSSPENFKQTTRLSMTNYFHCSSIRGFKPLSHSVEDFNNLSLRLTALQMKPARVSDVFSLPFYKEGQQQLV